MQLAPRYIAKKAGDPSAAFRDFDDILMNLPHAASAN